MSCVVSMQKPAQHARPPAQGGPASVHPGTHLPDGLH
jgi:hypothetical protein